MEKMTTTMLQLMRIQATVKKILHSKQAGIISEILESILKNLGFFSFKKLLETK